MKTRELIHAQIKERLHGDPVPPFTAMEILLCDAIDALSDRISAAHSKIHHLAKKDDGA